MFFQDSRKGKVRNTVVTKAGVQMRACMGVCDKAPTRSDGAFNSRARLQASLLHIKNPTRLIHHGLAKQSSLDSSPARLNFCPDDHSVLSFCMQPAGRVRGVSQDAGRDSDRGEVTRMITARAPVGGGMASDVVSVCRSSVPRPGVASCPCGHSIGHTMPPGRWIHVSNML